MVARNISTQEILLKSGAESEIGFVPITDKLLKKMKNSASASFGLNVKYSSMSDDELTIIFNTLPRIVNDMTPEQAKMSYQITNERYKRYYGIKEQYETSIVQQYAEYERIGFWDNGEIFPKVGDKVVRVIPNIIGLATEIIGRVYKSKSGIDMVSARGNGNLGGKVTSKLTKSWKKVDK